MDDVQLVVELINSKEIEVDNTLSHVTEIKHKAEAVEQKKINKAR